MVHAPWCNLLRSGDYVVKKEKKTTSRRVGERRKEDDETTKKERGRRPASQEDKRQRKKKTTKRREKERGRRPASRASSRGRLSVWPLEERHDVKTNNTSATRKTEETERKRRGTERRQELETVGYNGPNSAAPTSTMLRRKGSLFLFFLLTLFCFFRVGGRGDDGVRRWHTFEKGRRRRRNGIATMHGPHNGRQESSPLGCGTSKGGPRSHGKIFFLKNKIFIMHSFHHLPAYRQQVARVCYCACRHG